jgi:hypothetical protein
MPYYPKSQIKTNLYTSGGEYSLAPPNSYFQESYIGYYYKLSNGRTYTGKNPTDGTRQFLYAINPNYPNNLALSSKNLIDPNPSLIELDLTNQAQQYNTLLGNKTPNNRLIPVYNLTTPTQKDYELGVFTRYFCKKNNEPKYLEIDKKTFDLLSSKSKNIAWDLYTPISTLWYITGDKIEVAKTNKGLINLIETQQKWYGFLQYFKDQYSKYYLAS